MTLPNPIYLVPRLVASVLSRPAHLSWFLTSTSTSLYTVSRGPLHSRTSGELRGQPSPTFTTAASREPSCSEVVARVCFHFDVPR